MWVKWESGSNGKRGHVGNMGGLDKSGGSNGPGGSEFKHSVRLVGQLGKVRVGWCEKVWEGGPEGSGGVDR
jgi:hypothetical protein